MNARALLLIALALGFYNVGTIWAHEIDIFRSWKIIRTNDFHTLRTVHWHKLPYWVFAPVGLWLGVSLVLLVYPPHNNRAWEA